MSIKVKNITKYYNGHKALNNVSFTVDSGEIVSFIGPNGAGKSTMMKIICGIIPPFQGEVYINEINILAGAKKVRNKLGYLPEHNPLYTDMYVKEYLNYVSGIYKLKNAPDRIEKVITFTGLEKEYKKKIGSLSKGYRQRVGLAQALVHDPEVLILDEPTTGLDPNQIVEIRNLISDVGREKTVLLSTHLMQEVEAISDRVIIINNGEIVADDNTNSLKKKHLGKSQTIRVEFREKVEPESLSGLRGLGKLKKISNNEWLIESNLDEDFRPVLFSYAVENNLTVLSLQKMDKNLEEVFQELTKIK